MVPSFRGTETQEEKTRICQGGDRNMEKRSYPFFYAGEKQEFGKAVVAGGFVFLSGVSGREVATGKVKSVDIREQTRTAWGKVALALQEVGSTLSKIVKIV